MQTERRGTVSQGSALASKSSLGLGTGWLCTRQQAEYATYPYPGFVSEV